MANVDLNAINRDIAGGRLGRNAPRFRTCGLRVDLQVFFTNKDGDTDKPLYNAKTIHATATASAATGLWSGSGPRTVYEVYPSGDHGAMTYDKVFVYAQGVAFHFKTTGLFYKFDAQYVVLVLVSGIVLLALAKFVAQQVSLYLIPGISQMIYNRTREVFDVRTRFAEIGMKAALASLQFHVLDVNGDGVLDTEDLVATYATLHGVTAEEAIAVAKLVSAAADKETDALGRPKKQTKKQAAVRPETQGVDFSEFLVAREGGQMIGFRQFLDLVTKASRNVRHIGARRRSQLAWHTMRLGYGVGCWHAVPPDGRSLALCLPERRFPSASVLPRQRRWRRDRGRRGQARRGVDGALPQETRGGDRGRARQNGVSPLSRRRRVLLYCRRLDCGAERRRHAAVAVGRLEAHHQPVAPRPVLVPAPAHWRQAGQVPAGRLTEEAMSVAHRHAGAKTGGQMHVFAPCSPR